MIKKIRSYCIVFFYSHWNLRGFVLDILNIYSYKKAKDWSVFRLETSKEHILFNILFIKIKIYLKNE